jgi:hypothetical protein
LETSATEKYRPSNILFKLWHDILGLAPTYRLFVTEPSLEFGDALSDFAGDMWAPTREFSRYAVRSVTTAVEALLFTNARFLDNVARLVDGKGSTTLLLDPVEITRRFREMYYNLARFGESLSGFVSTFEDLSNPDAFAACKRKAKINYVLEGSLKAHGIYADACQARPKDTPRTYACDVPLESRGGTDLAELCSVHIPYHLLQTQPLCALADVVEVSTEGVVEVVNAAYDEGVYFVSDVINCMFSKQTGGTCAGMATTLQRGLMRMNVINMGFCEYGELVTKLANLVVSVFRVSFSWLYDVTGYDPELGGTSAPSCVSLPRETCVSVGTGPAKLVQGSGLCDRERCYCAWVPEEYSGGSKRDGFCISACRLVTASASCGTISSVDPVGQCRWIDGACISPRDNLQEYPIEAALVTTLAAVGNFPMYIARALNKTTADTMPVLPGPDVDVFDSLARFLVNLGRSPMRTLMDLERGLLAAYRDVTVAGLQLFRAFDVVIFGRNTPEFEQFQTFVIDFVNMLTTLSESLSRDVEELIMHVVDAVASFFKVLFRGDGIDEFAKKLLNLMLQYSKFASQAIFKFILNSPIGALIEALFEAICRVISQITSLQDALTNGVCSVVQANFIPTGVSVSRWLKVRIKMSSLGDLIGGSKMPFLEKCGTSESGLGMSCRFDFTVDPGNPNEPDACTSTLDVSLDKDLTGSSKVAASKLQEMFENGRITHIAGTQLNTLYDFDVGGGTSAMSNLIAGAGDGETTYGILGCTWCMVTHPSQCLAPDRDKTDAYNMDPCPCEFCAATHGAASVQADNYWYSDARDDHTYHCNTGTGFCQCGTPPGGVVARRREVNLKTGVKEDVVCPGGEIPQLARKYFFTPTYRHYDDLCYTRSAYRCDREFVTSKKLYTSKTGTEEVNGKPTFFHLPGDYTTYYDSQICVAFENAKSGAGDHDGPCRDDRTGVDRSKPENVYDSGNGVYLLREDSEDYRKCRAEYLANERLRCAVHFCLADMPLEGPYPCRQFCDPHPYNDKNVLNTAFYRVEDSVEFFGGERRDTGAWVYYMDHTKSDTGTEYNNPFTKNDAFGLFLGQHDQATKAAYQDVALDSFCVCDIGYGYTGLQYDESKIQSTRETTNGGFSFSGKQPDGFFPDVRKTSDGGQVNTTLRSWSSFDQAAALASTATAPPSTATAPPSTTTAPASSQSAAPVDEYQFRVPGAGFSFAGTRSAESDHTSEWTAAADQSPGRRRLSRANVDQTKTVVPSSECFTERPCHAMSGMCFDAERGVIPCASCVSSSFFGRPVQRTCDPLQNRCVCGPPERSLDRVLPPREELRRVAQHVREARDGAVWTGESFCDKVVRAYADTAELTALELYTIESCIRLRVAAVRVSRDLGLPTLPLDIFYNPWRPLLLASHMTIGVTTLVSTDSFTEAWAELDAAGVDPVLSAQVVGMIETLFNATKSMLGMASTGGMKSAVHKAVAEVSDDDTAAAVSRGFDVAVRMGNKVVEHMWDSDLTTRVAPALGYAVRKSLVGVSPDEREYFEWAKAVNKRAKDNLLAALPSEGTARLDDGLQEDDDRYATTARAVAVGVDDRPRPLTHGELPVPRARTGGRALKHVAERWDRSPLASFEDAQLAAKRLLLASRVFAGTAATQVDPLPTTCDIFDRWLDEGGDAIEAISTYYSDTFDLKLCAFLTELYGNDGQCTNDDTRARTLVYTHEKGTRFSVGTKFVDTFQGVTDFVQEQVIDNVPALRVSIPSLDTRDVNSWFASLFKIFVPSFSKLNTLGDSILDRTEEVAVAVVEAANDLFGCDYAPLYGKFDPTTTTRADRPTVLQTAQLFVLFGSVAMLVYVVVLTGAPPVAPIFMVLLALGGTLGAAFVFLRVQYNYQVGCMFGTIPALPAELADDLYYFVDTVLLPDDAPAGLQSYVQVRESSPSLRCDEDPWGMRDGIRVAFYALERARPGWRESMQSTTYGKRLFRFVVSLPFVGDAAEYYEHIDLLDGDVRKKYDACYDVMWAANGVSLAAQLSLVVVVFNVSLALLYNFVCFLYVVGRVIDRTIRVTNRTVMELLVATVDDDEDDYGNV